MNTHRPKNLNLLTIRFPITAIVSIFHRISGVVLFLSIPVLLCALKSSLSSEAHFQELCDNLTTLWGKGLAWIIISAFLFHFVAGIRHLLMDINIGIELRSGKLAAWITLILSFLLIGLAGVYLW